MGETSSKSLRGNKMDDVIFDGTKARRSVGFAQVSLIMDNSDGELPIEYSDVCISRRYYRSGESEYYINGAQTRLKDIQNLLRDTGLGRDGYSIIGQGTITEIITAKSNERRYLFEEAAGISKFKYKKEESKKKLAMTQDNILRLNDILSELAERLPTLEKQSEKAKKYLSLRDEKKVLDIGLWLHALETSEVAFKKAEETVAVLSNDISDADSKLAKTEDQIDENTKKTQKLTEEIETLRVDSKSFETSLQEGNTQILVLQKDIEHTQESIARLDEEIKAVENEKVLLNERKSTIEENIRILEEELLEINQENQKLLEEQEEKHSSVKQYFEKIDNLELSRDRNTKAAEELRLKLAMLRQAAENGENKLKSLEEDYSFAKERESSLRKSFEEAKIKAEEISNKLNENNNIIKGHQLKYDLQKIKRDTLGSEKQKLETKIAEKENRRKLLDEMEKNHEGFAGSVHMVLNEAKRGILQGIHGTVANLINVDPAHTVAIETALGAGIQNIVTLNDAAAKSAIFWLKNRKAGRATFLPVSSIKGRTLNVQGFQGSEGFLGIASNLVTVDDKYREVINFLLGRTVVVDSLDNAVAIAKKNNYSFKIVTSDGQVINSGGSLTGGSVARNIGILSRRNEIDSLSKEVMKLQGELAEKTKTFNELEGETSRISALIDGVKEEIAFLEKQQIEQNSELQHISQFIANIEEQTEVFDKEKAAAEKQIKDSIEEIHKEEEQEKVLTEEAETIKMQLENLEKQNSELKEEQDKLISLLHENSIKSINKENEKKTLSESLLRDDDTKARQDEKISQCQQEKKQNRIKIAEFEQNIIQINQKTEDIQKQIQALGTTVQEKIEQRMQTEKTITHLYESEKEIFGLKEKLAREIEKTEAGRRNAEENLNNMQSKLWDEYEITVSEAKTGYKKPENIQEAQKRTTDLRNQIRNLGAINIEAIEEYISVKERYESMSTQVEDLVKTKEELEKIILTIENEMATIFEEKFHEISREFEKTFRELFDGGEAKLSFTDEANVLESGIDIYVAPPGKIIKNMSALSGGEQALTAIALYFAILNIHPAPFCLLDEIEAALDDVNVTRYAEYLHKFTDKTQLITITHRRGTMEIADRLYGVTMKEKGISRILTINVNEIENNLV